MIGSLYCDWQSRVYTVIGRARSLLNASVVDQTIRAAIRSSRSLSLRSLPLLKWKPSRRGVAQACGPSGPGCIHPSPVLLHLASPPLTQPRPIPPGVNPHHPAHCPTSLSPRTPPTQPLTPPNPSPAAHCQDVAAFRAAALIIAPHGAGLANLIFALPGPIASSYRQPWYRSPSCRPFFSLQLLGCAGCCLPTSHSPLVIAFLLPPTSHLHSLPSYYLPLLTPCHYLLTTCHFSLL